MLCISKLRASQNCYTRVYVIMLGIFTESLLIAKMIWWGLNISKFSGTFSENNRIYTCHFHTFLVLFEDTDPFWLWGDWLLSETAEGDWGTELCKSEDGTKGIEVSSKGVSNGLEREWPICGIIVRLLGFLQS